MSEQHEGVKQEEPEQEKGKVEIEKSADGPNKITVGDSKRESAREHRREIFDMMKENLRLFSAEDYKKIYEPVRRYWGASSPAFVGGEKAMGELFPDDVFGGFVIAVDRDSVPDEDFIKYLAEHECWELYVHVKKGFNFKPAMIADSKLPILEKKRLEHRHATLREFQLAEKDGKLDAYMQWWRDFYQADVEDIKGLPQEDIDRISRNYGNDSGDRDIIIQRILKNQRIKEEVYAKVVSKRKK